MEKRDSIYKQGKKKARIGIDGVNIGGLVVWGGALAVASLVAAFAVKKKPKRDGNKRDCNQKEEDEKGCHGLHSVLQTPSSTFDHNPCCTNHGLAEKVVTQTDSCELVSTQILIQEENPTPVLIDGGTENSINVHEEIILTDDSKHGSIASCDGCGNTEEFSLPVPDGSSWNEMENEIKIGTGEDSTVKEEDDEKVDTRDDSTLERTEVRKEEEAVEIATKIASMDSVEEEEQESGDDRDDYEEEEQEEDNNEDYVIEKCKESSQGTEITMTAKISSMQSVEEDKDEKDDDEEENSNEEYVVENSEVSWQQTGSSTATKISSMQSVEEEKDDEDEEDSNEEFVIENEKEEKDDEDEEDSNEEYVIENGEDSPQGTGSSSTESNSEAIWPVESIEAVSLELENTMNDLQKTFEKTVEEDRTTKTEDCDHLNNRESVIVDNSRENHEAPKKSIFLSKEGPLQLVVGKYQIDHSTKWRISVSITLVFMLLVLLLSIHFSASLSS